MSAVVEVETDSPRVPRWKITPRQWVFVVLVLLGVAFVFWTYEALNFRTLLESLADILAL